MESRVFSRIDVPAAWCDDETGGKVGLTRSLNPSELLAIEEVVAATASLPLVEIRAADCQKLALVELGCYCRQELREGRGVLVLAGIDPGQLGAENVQRA